MMRPPIGSVVLSLLDRFVRLFPRSNVACCLSGSAGLELHANGQEAYWVNNNSSYFSLQGDDIVGTAGWLYIEGVLQRYCLTRAKLYYNDGTGFTEDNYFTIPVTRRGYIREIIYLPPGVVDLRWAPVDSPGFFIQHSFSITRITCFEASLRALYRALYDFRRFFRVKERRTEAVEKLLHPLLCFKLWQAYRNTIDFRVFDSTSRTCNELWHAYQASLQQLLPQLTTHALSLKHHPLISVVVSLPEQPEKMLASLICSLQQQIYPHWELLVYSDDIEFCDQCLGADVDFSDVRLFFINSGPSESLKRAQGRYIVVLGSDVLLEPQALFRVAQTFTTTNAGLLYGDVALVDPEGDRVVEFDCRPAFSPELLRCHPYVDDMLAFNCGFLEGYKLPADSPCRLIIHDMLMQAYISGVEVAHVAEFVCKKVHYPKPVEQACTTFNLKSDLRVAIIIPTKNAAELVKQCIESLECTILAGAIRYTIILIDHASDDPAALQYFNELSALHSVLRYEGDFNFSAINNWAVSQLSDDYTHYLFCNNDIEAFHKGWLETMLGFGQQDDVGVVGVQLLYPDKLHIQHAGVCVGLHGLAEHYGKFLSTDEKSRELLHTDAQIALTCPHEVSAVTAACMLVRRDAFEKVDGFDDGFAVGFGDVDICLRIREAGYRIIYSPESTLVHHESATRGKNGGNPHPSDTKLFEKRWQTLIDRGDPYYHPAYSKYSYVWRYVDPLTISLAPKIRMNV